METCVRNGYYQEAMELSSHAKDLQRRYVRMRLVQDVAREVESVEQLMLAQLFSLLREPVKLPTAIKTVSYLRRMNLMDELSIGLAFLSGRLFNFRIQLLQLEKDRTEPIKYLRRYIDFFREHVYDIMSQFTALFDDFDALMSFAGQCITDLVSLVSSYVPKIASDPASLSSVLIQLGYCSLSFSRLGLDFAPLIAAPFADTVLATYSYAVAAAADRLSHILKTATKGQGVPTDSLIDTEKRAALLASPPNLQVEGENPPSISHFPPLAIFLNEMLSALNSLRLLAPVITASHVAEVLSGVLLNVTNVVLEFVREAVMLHEVPNGKASRPTHARTPSSPRAQLLRRNTETHLAPTVRAAKRRESHQICVSFAEAWVVTVHFLLQALMNGIYEGVSMSTDQQLAGGVEDLVAWIKTNKVSESHADRFNAVVTADLDSTDTLPQTKSQTVSQTGIPSRMTASSLDDVFGPPLTANVVPSTLKAQNGSPLATTTPESEPTKEVCPDGRRNEPAVNTSPQAPSSVGPASSSLTLAVSLPAVTRPVVKDSGLSQIATTLDAFAHEGSLPPKQADSTLLVESMFTAVRTEPDINAVIQESLPSIVPPQARETPERSDSPDAGVPGIITGTAAVPTAEVSVQNDLPNKPFPALDASEGAAVDSETISQSLSSPEHEPNEDVAAYNAAASSAAANVPSNGLTPTTLSITTPESLPAVQNPEGSSLPVNSAGNPRDVSVTQSGSCDIRKETEHGLRSANQDGVNTESPPDAVDPAQGTDSIDASGIAGIPSPEPSTRNETAVGLDNPEQSIKDQNAGDIQSGGSGKKKKKKKKK